MSSNAAWRLIFANEPKYKKSYRPRNLPNAPRNLVLPVEAPVDDWTSPHATNGAWPTGNNSKKYTVAMVQSEKPLNNAQHNRLLKRLEGVTAL